MSKVHKELIQLNSKKQIPKLKTAKGPEQFFQRGTETAAMNEKELDVTSLQGNANQNQGNANQNQGNANQNQGNANQNRGEPPPRACLEGPIQEAADGGRGCACAGHCWWERGLAQPLREAARWGLKTLKIQRLHGPGTPRLGIEPKGKPP